jgi:FkbM family methyltransferase
MTAAKSGKSDNKRPDGTSVIIVPPCPLANGTLLLVVALDQVISALFETNGIEPILVDVGASGGTPRIWQPIRQHSTYIGFDGDERELPTSPEQEQQHPQAKEFKHARFVHEVITADPGGGGTVRFYLTHSPYCSSTLRPNPTITDNFLSAECFIIESEEQVKASTLDEVVHRLNLDRIDWMKIDTQGTDLRIFASLDQQVRDRMLAIDVEPGLRGAYMGEDLFCDIHQRFMAEGLWLSNLKVCGLVRMRKTTLDELSKVDPTLDDQAIARTLRTTPGWTECRYLRSLESLAKVGGTKRDYVLLWVFSAIDKQWGFCLDLALEYARLFGSDASEQVMKAESLAQIEAARVALKQAQINAQMNGKAGILTRVKRRIKRVLSQGLSLV